MPRDQLSDAHSPAEHCCGLNAGVALVGAALCVLFMGQPSSICHAQLSDQLTTSDAATLTTNLNIIAADSGWPQASVIAANDILSKATYPSAAWQGYFSTYFSTRPLTDRLNNYLGYPVFAWFDSTVHEKLQKGLYQPLLQQRISPAWATAASSGSATFSGNAGLRQDLHNSMAMLTNIAKSNLLSSTDRQAVYSTASSLYGQYPSLLKRAATFNRTTQPYFATLRADLDMVILASASSSSPSRLTLTPTQRSEIATTLGLSGSAANLWENHSVLYVDNNMSNAAQYAVLDKALSLVPKTLHNTASITVNDYLGNSATYQAESLSVARAYYGVNIFGLRVGQATENSFPSDVAPGITDIFSSCLLHELNHIVDAFYIQGNPTLDARRLALISAAGNDSQNYLRSMFSNDFFTTYPQEFFASISNEWFTDSAKTMQLGLARFDAGRSQPLNQALFFADVYSQGTAETFFYSNDVLGNLTRFVVPLTRNNVGNITSMAWGEAEYRFDLDGSGNVLGYSVVAVPEPSTYALALMGLGVSGWAMRRRKRAA